MSLTYKIDKFQTDPDDATKTLVGLAVSDASGNLFIIDKRVTTGSNSDEQLVAAAQSMTCCSSCVAIYSYLIRAAKCRWKKRKISLE